MKRILSFVLAMVMLIGLLPTTTLASESEEKEDNLWNGRSAVFVGDSITAGAGTTKLYYQFLEETLGFGSVTAMGVNGSCISTASNYGQSKEPLINRYQNIPSTDLIMIFMGTNDYGHETPLGTAADTQDGTFYGALNVIIPALVAKHTSSKIVFVTSLHRYSVGTSEILGTKFTYDSIPNGVGATLQDYVNALKTVCADNGVSVIDLYTECTLDPTDSTVRSAYMPDGLHPNAAGHELIAEIMESHIRGYEPVESEPVVQTDMIQGNKFANGNNQPCRASSRINYCLKAGTVITLKDPAAMQWACAKTSNEYSSNNLGYFPDKQWTDKETAVVESDGWVGFTFKYRDETKSFDLSKPLSDYITIEEQHTHTYTNGICTACGAAQWDTDGDGVLEILAIGNSFSVDALEYAYQIAQNLGVEEIVLGNLYIGGCTLATHAANAAGDLGKYTYYYNDNGTWTSTKNYKISTALESRGWDYVSMQQGSPVSGVESSYNEDLTNLITYVQERSDAKLVWHMTWAYQQNSTHSAFPTYNKDQMTMYNTIVSVVQNKIVPNSNFDLIVPNGTAVQNSRTSLLGDTTTRDGYHMSYDYGRYLTGLLFVKTVTGLSVDGVTYAPTGVDAEEMAIAIESVNNAATKPFEVTQSAYVKEEPVIPDEGYILLQPELHKGGYWKPTDSTKYNTIITAASNSNKYYATIRFTRETLPVGSIIILEDGWQYRPDGWITDAAQGSRADTTTQTYVIVTEEWWCEYTIRAFNISKVGLPSLSNVNEEEVRVAFRIYVPEELHKHMYDILITAPTCTGQGYTSYTCTLCGDSYVDDYVDALGHSYGEWTEISAPTEDTLGVQQRVCACGSTEAQEVEGVWQMYALADHLLELPKNVCCDTNLWALLPHEDVHFTSGKRWGANNTPVTSITIPLNAGDRVYATSWNKAGENGHETLNGIRLTFFSAYGIAQTLGPGESYSKFAANGGYLVAPEGTIAINIAMWYDSKDYEVFILNREHAYEHVTAVPTCTEQGYSGTICLGCGDGEILGYTEALGHLLTSHEAKAPTCTDIGWESYESCSRCGYSTYAEVSAQGHNYGKWEQIIAPTCDAEGRDKTVCTKCGETFIRDTRISGDPDKVLISNPVPEGYYEGKKILAIGDSLTAGTGVTKEQRYHALLAQRLNAANVSGGTSGATLCLGGHLPNKFETFMTANYLSKNNIDVVTIFLGINDWDNGVVNGTYQGKLKYDESLTYYDLGEFGTDDTTTIYGAAKMWCERILELKGTEGCEDIQFVFATPVITSWNKSVTTARDWNQDKVNVFGYTLRQYCTAIMEVCAYYEVPVLDLNMYSGMYYHSENDNNVDYFGGDGIHPGVNGHAMMADAFEEFLLEGYTYVSRNVSDCGHNFEETVTKATCTEGGFTTYRCPECHYSYVNDHVDAAGHSYANGICTVCGEDTVVAELEGKTLFLSGELEDGVRIFAAGYDSDGRFSGVKEFVWQGKPLSEELPAWEKVKLFFADDERLPLRQSIPLK